MPRLLTGCEVRAEGRILTGVVMRYGDQGSPGDILSAHGERFLPGSLVRSADADTFLDLEHDQTRVLVWEGAGLTFEDTAEALLMRAELPRIPLADLALAGVRSGRRTGLSIEFRDAVQSLIDGVSVVSRALLVGVGLVARPVYAGSQVSLRSAQTGRRRIWL